MTTRKSIIGSKAVKTACRMFFASFATAVAAGLSFSSQAATTITVDSVVQRWPWNNKIDITYTVNDGQDVAKSKFCKIVFTTVIGGKPYTIDGVRDLGASANTGTHTVTWTIPADVKIKRDDCTMTAAIYAADAPSGDDYMIVDLQTGAIAYEGRLASESELNARYNTNTYKKDKLVLRKVPRWSNRASLPNASELPADGYPTGDSVNHANDNSAKTWNTTRSYYVGIFPVTQAQYYQVVGRNPSRKTTAISGNTVNHRPVDNVSWDDLRVSGTEPTETVPAVESKSGTFFQRLNFMTGNKFGFDIPTEIMFEIAARAGASTAYFWGDKDITSCVVSSADPLTHDGTKAGNSTVAVGSKLPNAWGLYDMQGNVLEWCLDDYISGDNMGARKDAFIPAWKGEASQGRRRQRGAGTYRLAPENAVFRSSYRGHAEPTDTVSAGTSFRVFTIVD